METKSNVSVIIPTYNGAKKLPGILTALIQQTYQSFEVIIVIDGSDDGSQEVINKYAKGLDYKVISQENRGRAAVRNKGASLATGDLLVFFDDDMRPASKCLAIHIAHHIEYSGSILTGAQIEEVNVGHSDISHFKSHLSKQWSRQYDKEELSPLTKDEIFITAANFSIAKSTFKLIGGFDERLTDAEDYDLAKRAYLQNIPLYVNLQAHAWHDDIITCQSYIKRLRQYQKAQENLMRLKPELHDKNKFYQTKPTGVKKVIFSFFANHFWIQLVDEDRKLKLLPKKLRYKLYDVIVTANGVYYPEKVKL